MRVNEEEITGISDISPLTERQKKLNKKKPLSALLSEVPPIGNYAPIQVHDRDACTNLPENVDPHRPIDFYDLFITRELRSLFAFHTNTKAFKEVKGQSKGERNWHDTNEWEIGVFLGIILFMSLDHSPKIEDYWAYQFNRPIYPAIQNSMSLRRFQQIRRFFKISDPNNEADSKGPDWWKKLEPLSTAFQKASRKYYRPQSQISIDEQLILFKGRSRHTLNLHVKEAGHGFKIYSLCAGNYLLGFLYSSKVRVQSVAKYLEFGPEI